MDPLYETQATAIGGRGGSAASVDGALRVKLSTPQALGGPGGDGTNPEQLFAAGYAACFLSAIRSVAAREESLIAPDANVTATVGLRTRDDGAGLQIDLALDIDLPGLERADAERIVAAARNDCPFSAATRGNIGLRLTIA